MVDTRKILRDKTVSELKQLASDMDLSGYSNLQKDELIDLINQKCSEEEIGEYFGLDFADSDSMSKKIKTYQWLVAGVVVCIVSASVGLSLGYLGVGKADENQITYKKFTNKKFGFSVIFRESWNIGKEEISLNPMSRLKYSLLFQSQGDNIASITIFEKRNDTLATLQSMKIQQWQDNEKENILKIGDYSKIDGYNALGIATRAKYKEVLNRNLVYTIRDNLIYKFTLGATEDKFPKYQDEFIEMLDNFKFIQRTSDLNNEQ